MLKRPLFPDKRRRVAAVQMCSTPDVEANLQQATDLIEGAAQAGAEVVMLPENLLYLRLDEESLAPILFPDSEAYSSLIGTARRLGVWLLLGSLTEASGDPKRPYNTTILLDDAGEVRASYRKIHLFSLHNPERVIIDEKLTIMPGDQLTVVATPFGGMGLSICYDLRFPIRPTDGNLPQSYPSGRAS